MPPRKRTLPKENKLEDVSRTLDMLINAARNNFQSFVSFLHPQGRSKYILSRLHVFLASMVDDMVSGKRGRFQCVSVSPQHGKSQILSVRAVAWILGSQPGVYVAITGFSHDLLVGFVADIQTIMETWQYKQAFPGVEPIFGFDRQDELRLTNGSSLVAKTVGRKLTGRPVDWLFIDDAHAGRAEAESKADREKIKRWFFADCLSRLTPDGKVVAVGCLTGDTPVTMWDGSRKRMDALCVGDEVAQYSNGARVRAVVENWKDQGLDTVYCIKTGNHTVRANARHPWLVRESSSTESWVRTDSLKKGDKLVCSGLELLDGDHNITTEEAWAVGFMLGDGWVTINKKRNRKPNGTISNTRSYVTCFAAKVCQATNERMLSFLENKFGRRPKLTRFGYYRFEVAKAGRWFIQMGIVGGAKGKRVLPLLMCQPLAIRKSIISGFVDADGCISNNGRGRHYAYSCSIRLIGDLRSLVRSCGMNPSNIYSRTRMLKAPHSKSLICSSESSFAWQTTLTKDAFRTATIRSIEIMPQQERVYDIQVSGEESFIADGLVSHNTRWHPSDLIGHITSPEFVRMMEDAGYGELNFEVTNLPAIAEHNPEVGEEDPIGREPGEALFPEVRHLKFLLGQKAMMPKYEWDSQYRGKPRASASGQVDVGKIKYVDISEVPTDIQWLRGWDLALTEKQTSDFSAGALCAYDKRTESLYLIDVQQHKLSWMKMKPVVIDIAKQDKQKYNANTMGLEAVSGFEIGLQELRSELSGIVSIEKRNPPRGGKLMRAQAWLNLVEAGRFYMVRASWNKSVVDNLDTFPAVEHDDVEDAISVAFECIGPTAKKLLFA